MKNEIGNRYGRLTVIGLDKTTESRGAYWICKCDCGLTVSANGNRLRTGRLKSCGCLKREVSKNLGNAMRELSSARMKEFNATHTPTEAQRATMFKKTHGGTGERLHRIWMHMRERCNATKGDHARWYHDRGIRVCEEWDNDYTVFREWAYANGYYEQPKETPLKELLSIDRIDPTKGYSPDNCRWITFARNSQLRNEYHANQK